MKKLLIIIATAFILIGCSSQKSKAKESLKEYLRGWETFDDSLVLRNRNSNTVYEEDFKYYFKKIFSDPDGEVIVVKNIPQKAKLVIERITINGNYGEAIIDITSCNRGKILDSSEFIKRGETKDMSTSERLTYLTSKGSNYSGECYQYSNLAYLELEKINDSWVVTNDGKTSIMGPLSGYIVE